MKIAGGGVEWTYPWQLALPLQGGIDCSLHVAYIPLIGESSEGKSACEQAVWPWWCLTAKGHSVLVSLPLCFPGPLRFLTEMPPPDTTLGCHAAENRIGDVRKVERVLLSTQGSCEAGALVERGRISKSGRKAHSWLLLGKETRMHPPTDATHTQPHASYTCTTVLVSKKKF